MRPFMCVWPIRPLNDEPRTYAKLRLIARSMSSADWHSDLKPVFLFYFFSYENHFFH